MKTKIQKAQGDDTVYYILLDWKDSYQSKPWLIIFSPNIVVMVIRTVQKQILDQHQENSSPNQRAPCRIVLLRFTNSSVCMFRCCILSTLQYFNISINCNSSSTCVGLLKSNPDISHSGSVLYFSSIYNLNWGNM